MPNISPSILFDIKIFLHFLFSVFFLLQIFPHKIKSPNKALKFPSIRTTQSISFINHLPTIDSFEVTTYWVKDKSCKLKDANMAIETAPAIWIKGDRLLTCRPRASAYPLLFLQKRMGKLPPKKLPNANVLLYFS
jgi:hypothetical protein